EVRASKVTLSALSGLVPLVRLRREGTLVLPLRMVPPTALSEEEMKQAIAVCISLLSLALYGQSDRQPPDQPPASADLAATTEAMSRGHHHDHQHMSAHMFMSTLRDPEAGDAEKAQQVVEQARAALERYRDSNAALADGFKIFLPNIPQPMYHFTKWQYAV